MTDRSPRHDLARSRQVAVIREKAPQDIRRTLERREASKVRRSNATALQAIKEYAAHRVSG